MAAYTAGFMTHVTCRLTAKNRDQLRNLTLSNRVWAAFAVIYPHLGLVKRVAARGVCEEQVRCTPPPGSLQPRTNADDDVSDCVISQNDDVITSANDDDVDQAAPGDDQAEPGMTASWLGGLGELQAAPGDDQTEPGDDQAERGTTASWLGGLGRPQNSNDECHRQRFDDSIVCTA